MRWPAGWDCELELTPHVLKRMVDRWANREWTPRTSLLSWLPERPSTVRLRDEVLEAIAREQSLIARLEQEREVGASRSARQCATGRARCAPAFEPADQPGVGGCRRRTALRSPGRRRCTSWGAVPR